MASSPRPPLPLLLPRRHLNGNVSNFDILRTTGLENWSYEDVCHDLVLLFLLEILKMDLYSTIYSTASDNKICIKCDGWLVLNIHTRSDTLKVE